MSLSGTFSPQLWLAPLALRAASRERSEAGLEVAGEKMRRRMRRRRLGWAWLMSGVFAAGQVRRDWETGPLAGMSSSRHWATAELLTGDLQHDIY